MHALNRPWIYVHHFEYLHFRVWRTGVCMIWKLCFAVIILEIYFHNQWNDFMRLRHLGLSLNPFGWLKTDREQIQMKSEWRTARLVLKMQIRVITSSCPGLPMGNVTLTGHKHGIWLGFTALRLDYPAWSAPPSAALSTFVFHLYM